jgi:hypothetical protein
MPTTVVGFNNWFKIADELKPGTLRAVSRTAVAIQSIAIANAPKRSGWMASTIYSVTPDGGSTYGEADTPPGDSYLLPEEKPPDDHSALVGVAANYGEWVNYGHHTVNGGWVPAQPFWDPAVEKGQEMLDTSLEALANHLGGIGSGITI